MNEEKLTPIVEFENEESLKACLEYWKEVLFLKDWIIKVKLVDPPLLDGDIELQGRNEFQVAGKCCLIKLVKPNEDFKDHIVKYCAEVVLVHELLHCKYNWVYRSSDSIETCYYEELEHALIEQMAKSLIMAKYDLSFKWFENF